MGTYYKHKKTETIDVPYSFKCEQCMKDSGPLRATISAQAEMNSNFKDLDYNKNQALSENAHKNLVAELKNSYRNATEKNIYGKEFKDECPHCHKPQSWAVSGLKDDMFGTPVVCLIVGLIFAAGCYFFAGVDNSKQIAFIVGGIGIAAAVVTLLINIIKISSKKKQTSNVSQKNVPVIEWSAVQNLLNE